MAFDVLGRGTQQSGVITEPADPVVTAIAEQSPDLARHVVVIGVEAAGCSHAVRVRWFPADRAEAILLSQHLVVTLKCQAVTLKLLHPVVQADLLTSPAGGISPPPLLPESLRLARIAVFATWP